MTWLRTLREGVPRGNPPVRQAERDKILLTVTRYCPKCFNWVEVEQVGNRKPVVWCRGKEMFDHEPTTMEAVVARIEDEDPE